MPEVYSFLNTLKNDENFVSAQSLYRIAEFLGKPYSYIEWGKKNYYIETARGDLTDTLQSILMKVDLYDKTLLPFRYWSKNHVEMYRGFISVSKNEIAEWNEFLKEKFCCIKDNGDCNGSLAFQEKVEKKYSINYREETLDKLTIINSFEIVLDMSKTFVLIVGNKTDSVTAGSCRYCPEYKSWLSSCDRSGTIDYRSFIKYECDKAVAAGIKIVVLYNSTTVFRSKCPEAIRYKGTHVAMKSGTYSEWQWDYSAVKKAIIG